MTFENDNDWLDARITKVEALIEAFETAMTAVAGGAQSYSLDTGQTRQTVTKANLAEMRITLDQLENRRAELRLRRHGAGFIARPNT